MQSAKPQCVFVCVCVRRGMRLRLHLCKCVLVFAWRCMSQSAGTRETLEAPYGLCVAHRPLCSPPSPLPLHLSFSSLTLLLHHTSLIPRLSSSSLLPPTVSTYRDDLLCLTHTQTFSFFLFAALSSLYLLYLRYYLSLLSPYFQVFHSVVLLYHALLSPRALKARLMVTNAL